MLSVESYPAFYLGYINAYPSAAFSSNYKSPSTLPESFADNATPFSRREGVPYTPYECRACGGVPLRLFRKCCSIHLAESNMTAHLCITTYRSPNNEVLKLELCFVGQDCQRIPSILGATYGLQTKRLDISYNAIRSLEGLEKFPHLEELILDNNYIDDSVTLPHLDTLHTLSLNKNKVTNLEKFLDQISDKFPHLRYLSLLGNEACPNQLSSIDKDEKDYRRYRLYVLHRLRGLRFLDSTSVRKSEIREARTRGALMKTVKPPPHSVQKSNTEAENHKGPIEDQPKETSSATETQNHTQNGTAVKRGGGGGGGEFPDPTQKKPPHTGAYGVRRYHYVGQNSEGNRFISNEHL